MSNPGMNMQNEAAAALKGGQGAAPQAPPQQGQQQPSGDGGSLAAFAQAFARCEQTHQCTPQDRQILEAGLPKLVQMAKLTQQILQATQQGGQPQPGGGAPAPQPQQQQPVQ